MPIMERTDRIANGGYEADMETISGKRAVRAIRSKRFCAAAVLLLIVLLASACGGRERFLETEKTYPIWVEVKKHFDHTDSDTLLFFRNDGTLRLGCLIAINDSVDVESRIVEWEQIVKPLTLLGHMDKAGTICRKL